MKALDTALRLAKSGLSVIPIRTDGTKAPACETWKEFQIRIASEAEIQRMFRTDCGVGIVAGAVSGNLEVLDVESEARFEDFRALVTEHDPQLIDILPQVETPSGGQHLFYRCAEIAGNQKLAMKAGMNGNPDEVLFETRGQGGYVLTINSPAECHEERKQYRLVHGRLTQIPGITPAQRSLLLDCAKAFNEIRKEKREPKSVKAKNGNGNGTRPGDVFAERVNWSEILEPHGWACVSSRGQESYWRRPGKSFGFSATVNYAGSDLFYVFSTNASPFEYETSYSKFYAFALLEYAGDTKRAARALAQRFGMKDSIEIKTVIEPPQGDGEEAWPDALDPAACYGLAGEIVSMIEPHSESDPAAVLIQTLVAFGNAAGRNAYFQVEADRHYMNLYAVLVGDTSKARKGTSKGQVMSLFQSVDETWRRDCIKSGLSTGEGLIWAVRDPINKQEPVKDKGRVIDYQNVMVDGGVEDKRLLVVETEFASTLRVQGREANTLSATLRNAWDNGNLRILTKNSPAVATDAHVSVIGHITADELRRYLDSTHPERPRQCPRR